MAEELADEAYGDMPIAIGFGQAISTPWVVAFGAASLNLPANARVLEVAEKLIEVRLVPLVAGLAEC